MICAYCAQPMEAQARICRMCGMLVARVVRPADEGPAAALRPAFFPVSPHKFLILSICSLNLYQLYWFYENWKRIRAWSGDAMSPFWRTFFAIFWIVPFAQYIGRRARESGVPVWWSALGIGTAFIVVSLLLRLPDPWWLIALGTGPVLVPVVKTCEDVNRTAEIPEGPNDHYTAANVTTIVVGGLLLALIVVATFTQPVPL